MGIIISSFPGCGKTYLMNTHKDKAKMLDAWAEFSSVGEPTGDGYEYDYNLFVDEVMKVIGDYDIVFIPSGKEFIDAFNNRKIDYDLFYPSKERRGNFLEGFVRKRLPSKAIMMIDRMFDNEIDRLDSIEADNCYKHKMSEQGHFIGNDAAVMQYINNLKQISKTNEQSRTMEDNPRSEENHEADEEGNA